MQSAGSQALVKKNEHLQFVTLASFKDIFFFFEQAFVVDKICTSVILKQL